MGYMIRQVLRGLRKLQPNPTSQLIAIADLRLKISSSPFAPFSCTCSKNLLYGASFFLSSAGACPLELFDALSVLGIRANMSLLSSVLFLYRLMILYYPLSITMQKSSYQSPVGGQYIFWYGPEDWEGEKESDVYTTCQCRRVLTFPACIIL